MTAASGLNGARALAALTEAVVLRDEHELPAARHAAIEELGTETADRAVAVAGNFEMMNRLLDAVGVGPAPAMVPTGDSIGVPLPDRFRAR